MYEGFEVMAKNLLQCWTIPTDIDAGQFWKLSPKINSLTYFYGRERSSSSINDNTNVRRKLMKVEIVVSKYGKMVHSVNQ
jgi:hypothetical protein